MMQLDMHESTNEEADAFQQAFTTTSELVAELALLSDQCEALDSQYRDPVVCSTQSQSQSNLMGTALIDIETMNLI